MNKKNDERQTNTKTKGSRDRATEQSLRRARKGDEGRADGKEMAQVKRMEQVTAKSWDGYEGAKEGQTG